MTENKIIELLMKQAHTELSLEDSKMLDQYRAQSAENAAFIDDNIKILQHIPNYESKVIEFDVTQALTKAVSDTHLTLPTKAYV